MTTNPDSLICDDDWSDLTQHRQPELVDDERLHRWRLSRLRGQLEKTGAAMCLLVSPVSLRYAVNYRDYPLFQSHMPQTYLFLSMEGPTVIHGAMGGSSWADDTRAGRPISFFDGAERLGEYAEQLADDVVNYLKEIGTDNRRVAVEYINPSITRAFLSRGLEVIDGVLISEPARVIKSPDEINCIRWAVAVAEHGIARLKQALRPGVSEVKLWGLLNYTNLANNGDWHEGRMLASGPRINPWLQEASPRKVQSGDLVGLDTDMVGPRGYFADVSRTFLCGPARATARQRELYQLAFEEISHNLALIRPGLSLSEFQKCAYVPAEEFHQNAYPCVIHGVGMSDEYPQVKPAFRGENPYDGVIEKDMVICVESYMGAVGEGDGVKLEQQILVTKSGYELLSLSPLEAELMDA
ncbi:MAG: Xaa-Pro peptidase family protein [Pseudomonadota bacterium]|nr:Xaa-Pro peptidase family protein [Pseudomonadota bacterium]